MARSRNSRSKTRKLSTPVAYWLDGALSLAEEVVRLRYSNAAYKAHLTRYKNREKPAS